ncbi:MAG TPA: glycosyltransferase family 39 protein, partial [Candidatus Elarobacter sp.]
RYDVFRDELYFIVCGRHPQFGYADQPPLVPLLAAAFYGLGHQTWLLRFPVIVAAVLLVFLTVRFVRLLGGGNAAAAAAGIAAATAPELMGMFSTFNTTVFEPLAWTAIAYLLTRAALLGDRRGLLWSGVIGGLALEAKYSLSLWLIALLVGVVLTPQRRLLAYRELWIGIAIMVVIAIPSVLWQAANGWPFMALMHAAADKNAEIRLGSWIVNQILVQNPLFAPLWIAALIVPFVRHDLAVVRFLPIAYVVVTVLTIAGHGKDYYVAAAYPPLFAIGGVAFERLVRNATARAVYLGLAVVNAAVIAPMAVPILPPSQIQAYMQRLHVAPQRQEKGEEGSALPQEFADQLGWRDFVREVADAYRAVPTADRAQTSILVGNYGEAAAIDVYGGAYGLPPALSGHNQYGLWGLRGQHPANVLRVQHHVERLRPYCRDVRILGTTLSPYAMAYENGMTIAWCRSVTPKLATLWPRLQFFE